MFCPECKSMLVSSRGQLKCRKCGYIRKFIDSNQMKRKVEHSENEIKITEEKHTKFICPNCGSKSQSKVCETCRNTSSVNFSQVIKGKTILSNYEEVWPPRAVVEEVGELDLKDELNVIDKGNTNYF